MENINEQFKRLFCELDLTDDQAAMIKKLQRDVDAALQGVNEGVNHMKAHFENGLAIDINTLND